MPAPAETVLRIRAVLPHGDGAPALVETGSGERFVLKLRGAGGGERALATEFLALKLAALIGLRTPATIPLYLPEAFPWQAGTDEFDDMVQRSYGWNLGIRFIEEATPLRAAMLDSLAPDFCAVLAIADALLINVDRSRANPNLVRDRSGAVWAIDFGACLFLSRLLAGPIARPAALPANHFLAHRFTDFRPSLALDEAMVTAFVDAVPQSWLDEGVRAMLAQRLTVYLA